MKKRIVIRVFLACTMLITTLLSASCSNADTVAEYSKAVDGNKRDETAWLNLADAYYESGDVEAAIKTLEEALNYLDSKAIVEKLVSFKEKPADTTVSNEITESEATTTEEITTETSATTDYIVTTTVSETSDTYNDEMNTATEETELTISTDYISMYDYENVPFMTTDASSMLSEYDTIYFPVNVSFTDKSYVWAEGVSGDGIGEYIELTFWEESTIDMLIIHPGYAQLNGSTLTEIFEKNNRPRLIELEFSDGTTAQFELSDWNAEQELVFSRPITTEYVKITILSVYPGTDYQDTCITYVSAYRSAKEPDKDYNIHFDSDGTLRWDEYPSAIEYIVVTSEYSDGSDRVVDYCFSNDSVNYAFRMAEGSLDEGTYTLYVYAINENHSETYLGEIEYYYAPDTDSLKGRILNFKGYYQNGDEMWTRYGSSDYNIHFDNNGTMHWNEYNSAVEYKIEVTDGYQTTTTTELYSNCCTNYINDTLADYGNFSSGEMELKLYAIIYDGTEILLDNCEFYFARKSDELKETLDGTWHLAYYDDLTPEQYYEEYKSTLEQLGYDLNSCYVTAYLDSDERKITVCDFRGENEYKIEFYDNGIGIISDSMIERWEYNSEKNSCVLDNYGIKITYKR